MAWLIARVHSHRVGEPLNGVQKFPDISEAGNNYCDTKKKLILKKKKRQIIVY